MSDLKKWYLGGMVVAEDKAEFKEDEHPRGKGGMFVKKGEGGGGSSALEEVYKKGGFKNPDALAKSDIEELGKMDDSRLDAEITMLKGKVEEGGKPLDKARLEAAEGIMKGRGGKKVDTNGKIEGNGEESLKKAISELSDERLDIAIKNGERNAKRDDLSEEQRKRYSNTLPYLKAEKEKRGEKSKDEILKKSKELWDGMSDIQLEKHFEILGGKARHEIAASAELNGIRYFNDYVDALKEYVENRKKKEGQKVIKTKEEYSKALESFIKMEDWGDDISGISSVNKLKKIGDAPNYIIYAGKNGSEALKNRLEKLGLGVKETPNGNMQVFMK